MEQDLLEAFERCGRDPAADEARVAILVARVVDSSVSASAVEARLGELAQRCGAGQTPWEFLNAEGFAGNRHDYAALHNSNLAWVLAQRRGIPITLGVVLMRVARAAGHGAVGINFPGHFLVQVDEVLVDPFAMQPVTRQELLDGLAEEARGMPPSQLFAPASPVAVGLRMLNNVKINHLQAAAWHRALDAVDAQLRLLPGQGVLYLERGDLWRRIGLTEPARASYESALLLAEELPPVPAEALRQAATARLASLGGASDTVH